MRSYIAFTLSTGITGYPFLPLVYIILWPAHNVTAKLILLDSLIALVVYSLILISTLRVLSLADPLWAKSR